VRPWLVPFLLVGAIDLQLIGNPGYNQARGPVLVGSLRLHLEL
jgi:hypothetical protein